MNTRTMRQGVGIARGALAAALLTALAGTLWANPPQRPTAPGKPEAHWNKRDGQGPMRTPQPDGKDEGMKGEADAKAAAQGNNLLAIDLLAQMSEAQGESGGNVVFSPASISIALAMTHAGASGATASQMERGLHLPGPSPRCDEAWGEALKRLQRPGESAGAKGGGEGEGESDASEHGLILNIANRVWAANDLEVREEFARALKAFYASSVGKLDFGKPADAAEVINVWIKEQTRGLIPRLVEADHIHAQGMVLTNTIYFKGTWGDTFKKESTGPADFTLAGGGTTRAELMWQTDHFQYLAADLRLGNQRHPVQMVRLPYVGGAEALVILPGKPEEAGLLARALAKNGGAQQIEAMVASTGLRKVRLALPKVNIESKSSIADALKGLGVQRAFTDDAEFPGISTLPLKIADVLHAAKMIVDEKGTEAAAATAVIMAPTSAAPGYEDEPVQMIIDRPFLMIIRDVPTGAWLFVAKVEKP